MRTVQAWYLAGICHQPSGLRHLHDDRCDNKNEVQNGHAGTQCLLQLPATDLDAEYGATDHSKEQAGVEHQVGRLYRHPLELGITRFDRALHQPGDRQTNLCYKDAQKAVRNVPFCKVGAHSYWALCLADHCELCLTMVLKLC